MKTGNTLPLQIVETSVDKKMSGKTYIDVESGNFAAIDEYARIVNKELKKIKESPSVVYIRANKESDGYYSATVESIKELILNGIYIISLDQSNNNGSVNLRINGTITKDLYKMSPTNGTASVLEAGDILPNLEYIFRYDGNVLMLISSNVLSLDGKVLEDFVLKSEVIDSLDSFRSDVPLSAKQGKYLDENKANKQFDNVADDDFKKKALQSGVLTQLFLKDTETAATYNVQIENGQIVLMEVDIDGENAFNLIDTVTGKNYSLIVENSILNIKEV